MSRAIATTTTAAAVAAAAAATPWATAAAREAALREARGAFLLRSRLSTASTVSG
jgi:hypothetical protein